MTIKIQIRRGTQSDWTSWGGTLSAGEIAWETDTKKMKIGNGSASWGSLSYFPNSSVIEFTSGSVATTVASELISLGTSVVGLGSQILTKQSSSFTPVNGITASTISGALAELGTTKINTTATFGGQVRGTYGSITVSDTHGSSGVLTHHARSHTHAIADDGTVSHASLSNVGVNDHHNKSHDHNTDDSGTIAHSSLSGLSTDSGTASLHHTLGTGAFQAAAGNHSHGANFVYTIEDQTISSNSIYGTTILSFAVPGSAVATIDYLLPIQSTRFDTGFKVAWSSLPSGGTLAWSSTYSSGTTVYSTLTSTTLTGTSINVGTETLIKWVNIRGYYAGTASPAGTITFQFAKNSNGTGDSITLKRGARASYIIT